jgi:urease accessory protein
LTPARVIEVLAPGAWRGPPADHVTLSYDDRHRRRITVTGDHGLRALLDLPHAILLAGGSGLLLEDGRIVEVRARIEPLLEVRAENAASLLRLAWHIGNRHLSAQIEPDRILIRMDHVIALMLTGLGANVTEIQAPFDPEGGAYGGRHTSHDHGQDLGHDHGQDQAAPHGHDH